VRIVLASDLVRGASTTRNNGKADAEELTMITKQEAAAQANSTYGALMSLSRHRWSIDVVPGREGRGRDGAGGVCGKGVMPEALVRSCRSGHLG
jgi:hypothetical protein